MEKFEGICKRLKGGAPSRLKIELARAQLGFAFKCENKGHSYGFTGPYLRKIMMRMSARPTAERPLQSQLCYLATSPPQPNRDLPLVVCASLDQEREDDIPIERPCNCDSQDGGL